jgi:hypothetical protein
MEITIPPWAIDAVLGLVSLFSAMEWRAMVLIVAATLGGTQTLKVIWRLLPFTAGGGSALVNLFAAAVGFVCALTLWPAGAVPWWIAGMIAGPLAIGVFKLFFAVLRWKFPGLAAAVNFDRRRDAYPMPPAGVPERRRG